MSFSPISQILPVDDRSSIRYLNERIEDLNVIVLDMQNSFFSETHAEPDKPRELMIRFADGTDWDPGNGRGLYQRISSVWIKLSQVTWE